MRARSIVSFLALLVGLLAVFVLTYRVSELERMVRPIEEGRPAVPPVVPRGKLSDAERATTELFRESSGSVVHITTLDIQSDPFQLRILEVPRGTGSGFIWDDKGHVVTNSHVIETAQTARVTLPDHSVWPARLVGLSRRHDLAVLHVPGLAGRARALPLGTSRDLLVGQSVFAIGSPFGLDYTLSTGVISGLGREIPGPEKLPIRDMIQTDAAINPGNSGGPLLDSSGRLIGVNTAIYSPSGASAGIGFALPVDTVARVVPELVRFGREVRPVLGVELANDAVVRRLGLRGAMVLSVVPDSAAARAGVIGAQRDPNTGRVQLGDLIVGLDDSPIEGVWDLHVALDEKRPGDRVALLLRRDDAERKVELTLGANVE